MKRIIALVTAATLGLPVTTPAVAGQYHWLNVTAAACWDVPSLFDIYAKRLGFELQSGDAFFSQLADCDVHLPASATLVRQMVVYGVDGGSGVITVAFVKTPYAVGPVESIAGRATSIDTSRVWQAQLNVAVSPENELYRLNISLPGYGQTSNQYGIKSIGIEYYVP